ncbi:hypothetical protein ACFXO9_30875 [Nocardia tengchongensis]|uniref:hypothetical protein n=1 Tax=Nocardia tengchongensis TaxID=2055889 RepID=UPI00367D8C19
MVLNVDPEEMVAAATALWDLIHDTHAALPTGWPVPAGGDLHSAVAVNALRAQVESVFNRGVEVLNRIARHPNQIVAAMADYTAADSAGAESLGQGGGSDLSANPPVIEKFSPRQAPVASIPAATVDPLAFAQQLHSGPGTGPARAFADSIRHYLGEAHLAALDGLGNAMDTIANWTPVGTTVAAQLGAVQDGLGDLGSSLDSLASGVEGYADAFQTAKSRHPTPQEIIANRQKLLAAMRSKNAPALEEALARFNEQNTVSGQTQADYAAAVGSKTATRPVGTDPTSSLGTGGTSANGGVQSSGQNAAASTLSQMLPSLLSAMTNAGSQLSHHNPLQSGSDPAIEDPSGYPYEDLPAIPSYSDLGGPTFPGGEPGSPGGVEPAALTVGQLPVVPAPATLGASGLPRAPVIEPLPTPASTPPANRAGSSMMPYMPMAPGMTGTGGGGDRARVVAWHPDRLMYVDDTPFTDAVIGEKPTIAPTLTPPTPAPGNQAPANPGGTV